MSSALVSIHDVMPETLGRVSILLAQMPEGLRRGTVLLVVPGREWRPGDIDRLAQWQAEGLELAGHGWTHHTDRIGGWYHRAHSALVSRRAAEHLSRPRQALCELLARNHRWFVRQGLIPPRLYVPPAWALGALSAEDLADSPFSWVETASGLYHCATARHWRLPLLGFEADTPVRAATLRLWNWANLALVRPGRPPRLSIHPYDAELFLKRDLVRTLARFTHGMDYTDLFKAPSRFGRAVTVVRD